MLAEGFYAYQWEKNGVVVSGTSNSYTVTTPGTYRARFSRVSAPSATQWNKWSTPVVINETTTAIASLEDVEEIEMSTEVLSVTVYPNPARPDNIHIDVNSPGNGALRIQLLDQLGRSVFDDSLERVSGNGEADISVPGGLSEGIYLLRLSHGSQRVVERVMIRN
jgi:hypothetical protein